MARKSSRSPEWVEGLARTVRERRRALKLTQTELAELAGCGPDFLYDVERAKPTLRLDKLLAVLDTLGLGKISVGPPYFEAVFFPVMAPAAFLMAIGPIARWRDAPIPELAKRLKWAFAVAVLATVGFVLASGRFGGTQSGSTLGAIAFAIGIFLGLWLMVASVVAVIDRASQVKAPTWPARLRALPGGFWGMIVAHAGVGVFCIGVAAVKTLDVEVDAALGPGQTVSVRGYELHLLDMKEIAGPNYRAAQARVQVSRDGRVLFDLLPEKRFYPTTQSVMTEAAIDSGFTRDLYVALGEQLSASGAVMFATGHAAAHAHAVGAVAFAAQNDPAGHPRHAAADVARAAAL
jgi:cytochrome c-type biogenesis protein CcmF